ncbi:MAG: hypothetical protein M3401_13890 [Actinomycetota bacterium]|nr:hypothetical protein [Actinomycetota bacterium]
MSEDNKSNMLGVQMLGIVAGLCVVGVIWIAVFEPAQTTTKTSTPVVASQAAKVPKSKTPQAAPQPQATSTTTDKSSTALSVLATIASAAVGGIAGMLRPPPKDKKPEDQPQEKVGA